MIPRYFRPEMTSIWEPQTCFRIWFEIEAWARDALAELGVIPESAMKIWARPISCGSTSRASTRSSE